MKRITPIAAIGGSLIAISVFCAPLFASAASITANVSASSINSLGKFRVTMTATGVTSCTWSRLDNGTTWQWKDQPLVGTVYDSGEITGWAGAADYEWQFTCNDGMGGSVFGATSISISADSGSIIEDLGDSLASVIAAIIAATTNPNPSTTPAISVLPTPLIYIDTPTDGTFRDIHLIVTNTGGSGSLLTGAVSIVGDPSFTCFSGCTYTNIAPGAGPEVVIRFAPSTVGPKTATVEFSGGGGASVPASGTGVIPIPFIVATPQPVIDVAPAHTLFFYGVEMGAFRDKQFTIRNVGPAGTLLTGSVSVVSGAADFSCVANCSYVNLNTTDTHTATTRFRPAGAIGTKMGIVGFSGGGTATRYLNGEGYILSLTGGLDFQNVPVNTAKPLTFTVTNPSSFTNIGVGTLVVPPPFSCISGCTYNLPPGGSHTFTVTYTPQFPGPDAETGSLSGFPNSSFNFTGNGVRQYFRMQEQ